jgi:hypothetical protein
LHQLVVYVDDSAQILDRGHIVICRFLLGWFGRGGSEVALVRGLIGCLLDVGEWVDWRLM